MSTAQMVYVPPKTRSWAMSAVILGALYALTTCSSFFQYSKSVAMFGSGKATVSMVISIVSEIIALAFVIGGAYTLKGSTAGREALSYAGAGGVVMNVLSCIWSWIMFHDPAYVNTLNRATGTGGGGLPPNFFANMVTVMSIVLIVVGALQAWYCIAVYRHMSADPVDMPAPQPGHFDSGAWPPPPQG